MINHCFLPLLRDSDIGKEMDDAVEIACRYEPSPKIIKVGGKYAQFLEDRHKKEIERMLRMGLPATKGSLEMLITAWCNLKIQFISEEKFELV